MYSIVLISEESMDIQCKPHLVSAKVHYPVNEIYSPTKCDDRWQIHELVSVQYTNSLAFVLRVHGRGVANSSHKDVDLMFVQP